MKITALLISAIALIATGAFAARAQEKTPAGLNPQHFACYHVSETKTFKSRTVVLKDQFGSYKTSATSPTLLCAPVTKNDEASRDQQTHLVCYPVKGPHPKIKQVDVTNQFGTERLNIDTPRLLCVPSSKKPVG